MSFFIVEHKGFEWVFVYSTDTNVDTRIDHVKIIKKISIEEARVNITRKSMLAHRCLHDLKQKENEVNVW